jgi:hypothetical protein
MVLQEQEEGGTEAAASKTARAAMTCRATIRKQPRRRFALIDILSVSRGAHDPINCSEDEQIASQFWLRHEFR